MDPNANLAELRKLATELTDGRYLSKDDANEKACRLADLFVTLDEWITKGGFLPEKWMDCVYKG